MKLKQSMIVYTELQMLDFKKTFNISQFPMIVNYIEITNLVEPIPKNLPKCAHHLIQYFNNTFLEIFVKG